MNGTIEAGRRFGAVKRAGRVLQALFREGVFTFALFAAVIVALLDSVLTLNRGTFV
jgi:hypothetical protein